MKQEIGWRHIFNATADRLAGKKDFIIITTRLKSINSNTYKNMIVWCHENIEGSWGPGKLESYNGFITFRFWRDHEANEFIKLFKRFISNKEFLSY